MLFGSKLVILHASILSIATWDQFLERFSNIYLSVHMYPCI